MLSQATFISLTFILDEKQTDTEHGLGECHCYADKTTRTAMLSGFHQQFFLILHCCNTRCCRKRSTFVAQFMWTEKNIPKNLKADKEMKQGDVDTMSV